MKDKREVNLYSIPQYAIPFIINGDRDCITDSEEKEIIDFLNVLSKPLFGDISEPYFSWYNDMNGNRIGCTCIDIEISEVTE